MTRFLLLPLLFLLSLPVLNAQELIDEPQAIRDLSTVWDLDSANKQGTFKLTAYKLFMLPQGVGLTTQIHNPLVKTQSIVLPSLLPITILKRSFS